MQEITEISVIFDKLKADLEKSVGYLKTEFAVIKDNKICSGQYIIPIMNDAFSGWVSAHSKLIDFLLFIASAKQHKSFYNFRQKN